MKKSVFGILFLVLCMVYTAKASTIGKVLIDQGKVYSLYVEEKVCYLEIRNENAPINQVERKLIPIKPVDQNASNIAWDVALGMLYVLALPESAAENKSFDMANTILAFKIEAMQFTTIPVFESLPFYLMNKAFLESDVEAIRSGKVKFDISYFKDRVYVYVSDKSTKAAIYHSGVSGDWEMIDLTIYEADYVFMPSHVFYNADMLMKDVDCYECKITKSVYPSKDYNMLLLNKDKMLVRYLIQNVFTQLDPNATLHEGLEKYTQDAVFN